MLKKNVKLIWLLLVLSIFFVIVRIQPLINHQVAYTYDQGRDFLAASQIVENKDLVFIGPTTGIMGLFHGAWWYYLLTIPYLLFQGLPIGFYYFNFFIHYLCLVVLASFVYLEFGLIIAILAGLIIISAPYFIFTSLFVGNNIMAIPSLLGLLISLYYLIKIKKSEFWLYLANGLFLGLVAEFELSFGLFLIPSYLFLILVFKKLRLSFSQNKNWFFFLLGIIFIFLPRILFELKNNFSQTKILLNFFFKPKLFSPKPFINILTDRLNLFIDFYNDLFISEFLGQFVFYLLVITLVIIIKNKYYSSFLKIFSSLLFLLFTLSLTYKDTFWSNYYEGIHHLILLVAFIILFQIKSRLYKLTILLISGLLLLFLIFGFKVSKNSKPSGLLVQERVVDYLYQQAGNNFCLDIYTPPVIPYTYRYLFFYQHRFNKLPLPKEDWYQNSCWYILEDDDFPERKQSWIDSRIPKEAKLIKEKRINDIDIQLWQK